MNVAATAERAAAREVLGHPRGLATLFFTEMWERLSYYGMRALLVLFMTDQVANGGMQLTDAKATAIYGIYIAAVYLVALPGGWIADRLWGAQRAVWFGGIVIAAGHFVLAIPGLGPFFLGLLLVVLGTGLLKPNISAIVGELYGPGDPRRDSGFTIFYMGINVGATTGPLVCGWLAQTNWHYGFAAAGVGMVLGLVQFALTRPALGDAGLAPGAEAGERQRRIAWGSIAVTIVLALALLWAGLNGLLQLDAQRLARIAAFGTDRKSVV